MTRPVGWALTFETNQTGRGFINPSESRLLGALWQLNSYKNGMAIDKLAFKAVQHEGEVLLPPDTEFVIDAVTWTQKTNGK